jgi:hypothetical protein
LSDKTSTISGHVLKQLQQAFGVMLKQKERSNEKKKGTDME